LFLFVTAVPHIRAQAAPTVVINEVLVGNASINLDPDYTNYSSWIELYNPGSTIVDLSNHYLTNNMGIPNLWKIPKNTKIPPGGYLLFWADEEKGSRHTNFDLDMDGQDAALFTPTGTLVDGITFAAQQPDISFGRQPNGSATWVYFDQPTPAAANHTPGFATLDTAAAPQFSIAGGYYSGNQTLELSTTEISATIHYTLDGSKPTPNSTAYSGPIPITATTVVRARTFVADKLDSATATHTYLINITANLPVISISTDPKHLFDNQIGIYVVGTNGITGRCMTTPVNWNQPWERPSSIEMYETNGTLAFRQDTGFEIFGNCSRQHAQKSFEIKARKRYGDNDIDYRFFPNLSLNSFNRLVIRNSGNFDTKKTLFRDPMQQYLVKDQMDIDYQEYRPAVVYLNGVYWGVYSIRQKMDENFVESVYNLDEGEFDMLENKAIPLAGNTIAWDAFYRLVSQGGLADTAKYNAVAAQMDVSEFMNYFIVEIYGANREWPGNNIRYWRAYNNGIWRWVLFDLDAAFAMGKIKENTLQRILSVSGSDRDRYNSLIFSRLMQNPGFRAEFAQRFASHINITYNPTRVLTIIDTFKAGIAAEVPAHIARWGFPTSMANWEAYINELRGFANQRPAHMRLHLNSYLNNPGTANLTINIQGQGNVLVAEVKVPGNGYTGPYFRTIPIRLEAVPPPGSVFVQWLETGETSSTINVTLNANMTRTAVFESVPLPEVVINELYYNPADAQGIDEAYEFLELVNVGSNSVDLGGFQLSDGIAFTFPAGTTIAPGEYIVLTVLASTYTGQGYQVFQWDAGSALSNGGERIALLDNVGNVIDEVTYDDAAPWPLDPDGLDPSLALLDPSLDNSLPANWAASAAANGTPGAVNFP